MKIARHQRIVLAVGMFFVLLIKFDESISALSRMLFMPSWLAFLLIILTALLWVGAAVFIKRHPLEWVTKGQTFRYKKVGPLTHIFVAVFVGLLISGQIIKHFRTYKPEETARQEQPEHPQLVENEPQRADRENDSAALLKQLAAIQQPKDDVTKLKITSAVPMLMGDDGSLVIYTLGYGAIQRHQVQVVVNGRDVSSAIYNAQDNSNASFVSLMGNRKKINLRVGENVITVSVNGFTTEPYKFMAYEIPYNIPSALR